jgi:hypothetical protein
MELIHTQLEMQSSWRLVFCQEQRCFHYYVHPRFKDAILEAN